MSDKAQLKANLMTILAEDKNNDQPLKAAKPKFAHGEDPFAFYGYGLVSYFDLLRVMIWTFFFLSIFNFPLMYIYGSHNNYSNEAIDATPKYISLGNLGFSTTKCIESGLSSNTIVLKCDVGMISTIVDYFINSPTEDKQQCISNATG